MRHNEVPATGVLSEQNEEISYREISDLSDATEDNVPGEGSVMAGELDDYERLVAGTQKQKLNVLEEESSMEQSMTSEQAGGRKKKKAELADEFLRNFFIKFGMKQTLDDF